MKKILSLALILSILLSCGVFASPDAVVPESADEALTEVSGVEETAELAMEETVINYDFSKITEVPSCVPSNWNPTITDGTLQMTSPANWAYGDVAKFNFEDGATYNITAKIKSSAGNSYFLVGSSKGQDTTKRLYKWGSAGEKTITVTYTVDSGTFNYDNWDGLCLGSGSKGTVFNITSLKVVKVVNQIDVPYSLKDDSNFNIGKLPSNFGRFTTADYTAEVKDGAINIAAASGYPCVGFGFNLKEGETYQVHISGTTDNTTNVYFIILAGGVQAKNPLYTITSNTFSFDGMISLNSSIFKTGYDSSKLGSNTGFALTCNKATNFTITDFSVKKINDAKKTFTADNENVFTNGGFENGDVELFPVVSSNSACSVVTGDGNVKDGDYALMVTPGASNAWVNIGTNVEWQIDRKYKYEFDIKVLNFANGAAVTSGTADLRSLVYFPDSNATKGAQHSGYINSALPVGEWQHVEGYIDLDAITSNSGKGIASDADLTDGVFAFFFIPVSNQNYNYIIDNISLVRLPYETDIDVSYDFDNTARVFGTQWVHNNPDKSFGVGINDIATEVAEDPTDSENKVLKVTQNVAWGAVAFHMPLAENKVYTYSYDIYVADNSTNYGTNFVFNDDLSAQKKISHPQASTTSIPANTWTHVTGSFCPVKADKKSGQTLVAEDANLGENYFSIYTYVKSTFYIDNLVIKSYAPWDDEIAAEYAPVSDTENFSVRADENSGIRTFASVTHEQRGGCIEYGFIVALTDTLAANDNEELTFESKSKYVSGVSYGEDNGTKVDKIYRADGDKTIFAAVFTGITEANYKKALTFRPYLKVNYPNGGEKVAYGTVVSKSVYDVVASLNNPESVEGMSESEIEFCKKVIPEFGSFIE